MANRYLKKLGKLIDQEREKKGLSTEKFLEAFAGECPEGMSAASYAKLRTGHLPNIKIKRLAAIASVLGLDVEKLEKLYWMSKDPDYEFYSRHAGYYIALRPTYVDKTKLRVDLLEIRESTRGESTRVLRYQKEVSRYRYSGSAVKIGSSLYIDFMEDSGKERIVQNFFTDTSTDPFILFGVSLSNALDRTPYAFKEVLLKLSSPKKEDLQSIKESEWFDENKLEEFLKKYIRQELLISEGVVRRISEFFSRTEVRSALILASVPH